MIKLMKDPSVVVRDTTAWTMGRICELLPEAAINEMYLEPLLQCLIEGLGAEPRVASNVCWVGCGRLVPGGTSPGLSLRTRPALCPSGLLVSGGGGVRGHRCCQGHGRAQHLLPVLVL